MKKPAASNALAPKSGAAPTPSIIGADVQIEGNVRTLGELQLDGTILGDLNCGSLVMGENGAVSGAIMAENVTIRGRVKGEIRARVVRLEKTAVIDGDVYHESLSVESGARLSGRFAHTANPSDVKRADETPSFVASAKAAE